MKCPRCNYVSFDSMPRCKKCGFPFKPAPGRQEPLDIKSVIPETPAKGGKAEAGSADDALTRTVSSIRESLAEIDGKSSADGKGIPPEQAFEVDEQDLKFQVDSSYMDSSRQFPDASEINWEESVPLSDDGVSISFGVDDAGSTEPDRAEKSSERPLTAGDQFQGTLRQIGEELKEIEDAPPVAVETVAATRASRTGAFMRGEETIAVPRRRPLAARRKIRIVGARLVRYRQNEPILPDDRERVNRGQGLSLAPWPKGAISTPGSRATPSPENPPWPTRRRAFPAACLVPRRLGRNGGPARYRPHGRVTKTPERARANQRVERHRDPRLRARHGPRRCARGGAGARSLACSTTPCRRCTRRGRRTGGACCGSGRTAAASPASTPSRIGCCSL